MQSKHDSKETHQLKKNSIEWLNSCTMQTIELGKMKIQGLWYLVMENIFYVRRNVLKWEQDRKIKGKEKNLIKSASSEEIA